jgi:hypothetical protein
LIVAGGILAVEVVVLSAFDAGVVSPDVEMLSVLEGVVSAEVDVVGVVSVVTESDVEPVAVGVLSVASPPRRTIPNAPEASTPTPNNMVTVRTMPPRRSAFRPFISPAPLLSRSAA